ESVAERLVQQMQTFGALLLSPADTDKLRAACLPEGQANKKLVITIVDDKSGREVLKHTITVGADGNWSVTPNILPDGMYTI
ncbi:hypothetical protein MJI47_30865, partial [Salmonella enterica subsp. enterica serovar Kentucky]|nr:hypothetical protein [Salmonella enterica subsp. enterica serovar Kentucky]